MANNGKQTKISPLANHKKTQKNNIGAKVGFDRNYFSSRIEQYFDRVTNYIREINETFVYKNEAKKGKQESLKNEKINDSENLEMRDFKNLTAEKKAKANLLLWKIQEKIIQAKIKPQNKKKFIPRKEADRIINNASLLQYFQYLESVGLVKKDRETDKDVYYKNLQGEIIGVTENRWFNHGKNIGGRMIKAVQLMQDLEWMDALNKIIELNNEKVNIKPERKKKSLELVSTEIKAQENLFSQYKDLGISLLYADRYLNALKAKNNNGREFSTLGFKNESGGFYSFDSKCNSFTKIGAGDISVIKGSDSNLSKDVVIFTNYMEYMAYLQLNRMSNLKETAIILNERGNIDKLSKYLKNQVSGKIYSFADNLTVDILHERNFEIAELKKGKLSFLEQLKRKNQEDDTEENISKSKKM